MENNKHSNSTVNTEFTHYNFNCDSFKKREAEVLLSIISGGRLNDDMKFAGYGSITFDEENDSCHRYPSITTADSGGNAFMDISLGRSNANCITFDLPKTYRNSAYDKLFIYKTNGSTGKGVWYGWVAYDSASKKHSHRFFIEYDIQELVLALNRFFSQMKQNEHYNEMLREGRKTA